MSKTLKDGKEEKAKQKGGMGKKWTSRPKPKEKGGRRSLEDLLEGDD